LDFHESWAVSKLLTNEELIRFWEVAVSDWC